MGAPLRDGSWISFKGAKMRVIEIRNNGLVLYVPSPNPSAVGTTQLIQLSEARSMIERGELVPEHGGSIAGSDDKATEEMIRRRSYCQACKRLFEVHKGKPGWAKRPEEGYAKVAALTAKHLHAEKAKELGKKVREVAFVPPPSGSTLRAWYHAWIAGGDHALIPKHHLKGSTSGRLSRKVRAIVKTTVRDRFLVQERPAVSAVYDFVHNAIIEARKAVAGDPDALSELQIPHLETFRRFIARTVTEYEAKLRREGPKAASSLHRRSRPQEVLPFSEAQTDSTWLDLFVVLRPGDCGFDTAKHDAGKKQVARPHLTVVVDVATRMVLGFHIGLEPPSWSAVMNSLIHAIRPKSVDGCSPGAVWPVEGAPVVLRFDGGSENSFLDRQGSMAALDMTLVKCPVGKPKAKAHVERFIGTANRAFTANLPGKAFSNPKKRGEYDPERTATLTLDQVRQRFLIWIVDSYHNKGHRGAGMMRRTPLNVWQSFQHQLRAPPNISEDDLIACLSVVVPTKIRSGVIEFHELHYGPHLLGTDRKKSLKIRLDPRDLTQVLVMPEFSKTWMRVPKSPSNPPIADHLNLAQWDAYRVTVRKKGGPTEKQKAAQAAAAVIISEGTKPTYVRGSKNISTGFDKIDAGASLRASQNDPRN